MLRVVKENSLGPTFFTAGKTVSVSGCSHNSMLEILLAMIHLGGALTGVIDVEDIKASLAVENHALVNAVLARTRQGPLLDFWANSFPSGSDTHPSSLFTDSCFIV